MQHSYLPPLSVPPPPPALVSQRSSGEWERAEATPVERRGAGWSVSLAKLAALLKLYLLVRGGGDVMVLLGCSGAAEPASSRPNQLNHKYPAASKSLAGVGVGDRPASKRSLAWSAQVTST